MAFDIWDPFEDMKRMQREMNKIFEGYKPMKLIQKGKEALKFREPLADIAETDKEVIAKIELPGIDKKDIELNVTDNAIEVKAEKKDEIEVKEKGFYKHERTYSGFHRAFVLPTEVQPDQASAEFKNGMLEIRVPKVKQVELKKKKVLIK